jgi:hypothetical protein
MALPGYDWPRHCYLPHGALVAWLDRQGHQLAQPGRSDLAHAVALQSVLAAWRPTQGIYRLDPDVGMALACSPLSGEIPVAALRRLPEWCVYVETDPDWLAIDGLPPVHGFWLTLDWHSEQGDEARMVVDHGDALTLSLLPLPDGRTIPQAINAQGDALLHAIAAGESMTPGLLQGPDRWERVASLWARALSLALYLGADPELWSQRSAATAPPRQRQPPRRTKRGHRDHPPRSPEVWEVAYRLGAEIRRGREQTADADRNGRPRPHIRRAHWHGYWHGRGDARELRPRWLPPIPVAADDPTVADRPTIRRVED